MLLYLVCRTAHDDGRLLSEEVSRNLRELEEESSRPAATVGISSGHRELTISNRTAKRWSNTRLGNPH